MAIVFPKTDNVTNGLCKEGTFVFRIFDAWQPDKNLVIVKMVNAQGMCHTEFFNIMRKDGTPNNGALNAFAYFAKVALNDFDKESIEDPSELNDHFIRATIEHYEGNNGKTYARITEKSSADGFEEPACERVEKLQARHAPTTATETSSIEDIL